MTEDPQLVIVRIRVTLECPECASPIPVNGIVPSVLCHGCHEVVALQDRLSWRSIVTYTDGEPCMEHRVIVSGNEVAALDYFLAFDPTAPRRLYRRYQNILLEIDDAPPRCLACRAPLDAAALLRETLEPNVDAFCGACGAGVPLRAGSREDQQCIHQTLAAVVNETSPRGSLVEQESAEAILFSCMGCGAPLQIDAAVPRLSVCKYCDATNYLPDALWLRLHPAQRKQAFHLLLRVSKQARAAAKQRI